MIRLDGFCTAAYWLDEGVELRMVDELGRAQTVAIRAGGALAFNTIGSRRCIGYRTPSGDRFGCPTEASASEGDQCTACFERTGMLACMRCTGERCRSARWRESCVQPRNHAVYIASYGAGLDADGRDFIKVGVARWERRRQRVGERGSRQALIVARADGLEARRLETMIARLDRTQPGAVFGARTGTPIRDRLSATQRTDAWAHPDDPALIQAELRRRLRQLHRRIVSPYWLPENEVEQLSLPALPQLHGTPRPIVLRGWVQLRGRVAALYGATAIIDSDAGERVALDLNNLCGFRLRTLDDAELVQAQLALRLG